MPPVYKGPALVNNANNEWLSALIFLFLINRLPEHGAISVAALSEFAKKDGTHVALDHEDTSQGAIHCFQVTSGII